MAITRTHTLFIVFLAVFIVHVESKVITSGDSRWFIPVALSIIHQGNIDLDEYGERIRADQYYGIEKVNGHLYNIFPTGVALASLPFVWTIDLLFDKVAGISLEEHFKKNRSEQTELFIASIFVALAAVFMFLLAKHSLNNKTGPLLVVFVFAFGTSAWSTASRALWQHGPSILMLAASLYLLLKAREKESYIVFVGPLLAFAYLIRPTNMISYIMLMGVVFLRHRKYFWHSILFSLLVFGPFVALNYHVYGAVFPPYYQASRIAFGPSFSEAMAGNLISPNRGLFVFSPVLLLSFYGAYLKLRRKSFLSLDTALISIIVLHWIVISAFPHWWGGYSIGPRFFTDMIPYFVYFLIPVVEEIEFSHGVRRIAITTVFLCLLGLSFYAHYRSVVSWQVPAWNVTPESVDKNPARVWDWGDIQFMR